MQLFSFRYHFLPNFVCHCRQAKHVKHIKIFMRRYIISLIGRLMVKRCAKISTEIRSLKTLFKASTAIVWNQRKRWNTAIRICIATCCHGILFGMAKHEWCKLHIPLKPIRTSKCSPRFRSSDSVDAFWRGKVCAVCAVFGLSFLRDQRYFNDSIEMLSAVIWIIWFGKWIDGVYKKVQSSLFSLRFAFS